jgi:4-hydroxyproline epimerase
MSELPRSIDVVDSHTEGEPTRTVVDGWPDPPGETMVERREVLARTQDALRRAVVCEPRGHDAVVGALLTPPVESDSAAGVVFFNNAGALWMCGHGLIGVVRTLEHLGRVNPGPIRIDTAVGTVGAVLHEDGSVTIENVPAYTHLADAAVDVPGLGRVTGDVAWGGNWFYLAESPDLELDLGNVGALTAATTAIRLALVENKITGADGAEIDHVELFGAPTRSDAHSKNFVLCPGLAYDRSPCGTGTSAKLAALAARGKLAPGEVWRQESITGSLFTGWFEEREGAIVPFIRGRAFVTGRSTLFFDPDDPFRTGFSAL